MFDSVRTRLTLWYAGVLALSLIAFALLVYYAAAAIFYERQDESLRSTAETVASAYLEEVEEEQSLVKAGQIVLVELVFPNRFVQIVDAGGKTIATSRNLADSEITVPAKALSQAREQHISLLTINQRRVAIVPLSSNQELGYSVVAEPVGVIEPGLSRLRRDFFSGVPVVLLLASLGGYFLARKSLLPIASMNNQTQRISVENLSARLDVENPRDELGQLAITINDLLTRLENSFAEQQRFIADASHELRTPLAVLRGETEVALTKTRTVEEYKDSLTLINDEAERLTRIVEDLFLLARQPIDSPLVLINENVTLNTVIRDCARAAQVLADRRGIRLQAANDCQPITMKGDKELLTRMVLNLLDNALKYTPAAGEVLLALERQNGNAEIMVRDSGIGIPQSDQLHVFDRFYRVDKARSRALGGAGLGLSIVAWIVEVHRGKIRLESEPGRGSKFSVQLPLNGSE